MVRDLSAADRYASALFEIARLIHKDVEIEEELHSFSQALKSSPELKQFLESPQLKPEEKRVFLGKIYQERTQGIYEILLNFFTLLLEKNRFYLIHEITASFKQIADKARGIGTADIRTAVPLEPKAEAAIVAQLEKIAGYKIRVKKEIDPTLVGGVVVKIRNKVLDGSVKNRINVLKNELAKIKII